MTNPSLISAGGCTCRFVRYELTAKPIIVHCCHCSWCQRETGTAFALNAVIESAAVTLTSGEVDTVETPSLSGNGQIICRCPKCRVALWSHYHQSGPGIRFVRVGTLDRPGAFPPDIHIFTSTKQPWVVIPDHARAVAEFYNPREVWTAEALERFSLAKSQARQEDA